MLGVRRRGSGDTPRVSQAGDRDRDDGRTGREGRRAHVEAHSNHGMDGRTSPSARKRKLESEDEGDGTAGARREGHGRRVRPRWRHVASCSGSSVRLGADRSFWREPDDDGCHAGAAGPAIKRGRGDGEARGDAHRSDDTLQALGRRLALGRVGDRHGYDDDYQARDDRSRARREAPSRTRHSKSDQEVRGRKWDWRRCRNTTSFTMSRSSVVGSRSVALTDVVTKKFEQHTRSDIGTVLDKAEVCKSDSYGRVGDYRDRSDHGAGINMNLCGPIHGGRARVVTDFLGEVWDIRRGGHSPHVYEFARCYRLMRDDTMAFLVAICIKGRTLALYFAQGGHSYAGHPELRAQCAEVVKVLGLWPRDQAYSLDASGLYLCGAGVCSYLLGCDAWTEVNGVDYGLDDSDTAFLLNSGFLETRAWAGEITHNPLLMTRCLRHQRTKETDISQFLWKWVEDHGVSGILCKPMFHAYIDEGGRAISPPSEIINAKDGAFVVVLRPKDRDVEDVVLVVCEHPECTFPGFHPKTDRHGQLDDQALDELLRIRERVCYPQQKRDKLILHYYVAKFKCCISHMLSLEDMPLASSEDHEEQRRLMRYSYLPLVNGVRRDHHRGAGSRKGMEDRCMAGFLLLHWAAARCKREAGGGSSLEIAQFVGCSKGSQARHIGAEVCSPPGSIIFLFRDELSEGVSSELKEWNDAASLPCNRVTVIAALSGQLMIKGHGRSSAFIDLGDVAGYTGDPFTHRSELNILRCFISGDNVPLILRNDNKDRYFLRVRFLFSAEHDPLLMRVCTIRRISLGGKVTIEDERGIPAGRKDKVEEKLNNNDGLPAMELMRYNMTSILSPKGSGPWTRPAQEDSTTYHRHYLFTHGVITLYRREGGRQGATWDSLLFAGSDRTDEREERYRALSGVQSYGLLWTQCPPPQMENASNAAAGSVIQAQHASSTAQWSAPLLVERDEFNGVYSDMAEWFASLSEARKGDFSLLFDGYYDVEADALSQSGMDELFQSLINVWIPSLEKCELDGLFACVERIYDCVLNSETFTRKTKSAVTLWVLACLVLVSRGYEPSDNMGSMHDGRWTIYHHVEVRLSSGSPWKDFHLATWLESGFNTLHVARRGVEGLAHGYKAMYSTCCVELRNVLRGLLGFQDRRSLFLLDAAKYEDKGFEQLNKDIFEWFIALPRCDAHEIIDKVLVPIASEFCVMGRRADLEIVLGFKRVIWNFLLVLSPMVLNSAKYMFYLSRNVSSDRDPWPGWQSLVDEWVRLYVDGQRGECDQGGSMEPQPELPCPEVENSTCTRPAHHILG